MNPDLKNVPMAVGGDPKSRHGIILAKNELAKRYNVKTAETIWQAKKKCPSLVIVSPNHGLYEQYSAIINEIYKSYTDLVENFGIDESWLDVTGTMHLFGDGKHIADTLRERIKKEIGLTISVGVSFNKIFAKLGSDYKKPDATTVITRENYKEIVYPLPVGALLFVGKSTDKALSRMNIKTIGDLARADREMLKKLLGKSGELLHMYALGEDDSPVTSAYDKEALKSVGNGMTFCRDLKGEEEIKQGVIDLADSIAMRMRYYGVRCSTVQVAIKDPDFKTISRQKTLQRPTCLAKEIVSAAMGIIKSSWNMKNPIRTLTITGCNLVKTQECTQISLFDGDNATDDKQERLEKAIDNIRSKYGKSAILSGSIINNDIGIGKKRKS